jgi:hypothetical protein
VPIFLSINLSTHSDRNAITTQVKEALVASGGWVVDFHHFSNLSLCINFEIESQHLPQLHKALTALDVRLSNESCAQLLSLQDRPGERDVRGTLQITFIHDEPDLRRNVPPIPG